MTKKSKTITSLVMTLAMLPACVPVIPAAAETLDSAGLIIEDIDTYSKAEAIGSPVFVSDLYPTSGGIDTMTFMNNGSSGSYSGSGGKGRTFYINDTGYEDPNYPDYSVGRAITYRPSAAEEYYVSRTSSSGSVYTCDAYVERYAGDTWGFNGFLYDATSSDSAYSSNGGYVVDGRVKDVSAAADDGYAVYTIEIAEGTSLDGAYLALAYIDMDDSWIRSSGYEHRGIIVAGVPLTDYYDAEAMGKQTVAVPLSAFDLTDERVFLGAATGSSRPDYSIFSDYENYRATNSVQLDGLRGMGIVRNDTDAETVTPFSYIAYNLAIADGYTAPTLTATYDEAADGIALSWTESGYTNTTYTITKSNGTATETIDAGEAVTYTDTDVTAGTEYTYTVTSNVSMTSATTNATTYTIPSKSTAVTLTSESGGSTGSTVLDSESLIITEFDMSKGSSSTDAIGVPQPIFLSDYYVNSAGLNPISFMNTYRSYSTTSNGRRFYINDTGYQDTDAAEYSLERSITYRPKVTGEYYVSRLSGDGVTEYKSDAYVAHYVGHLENGTTAPDSWIHDKWGFNGYGFANNIVANNYMDITDHVDTAYALYKICIPDDVSLDGVYLAITHTDEKYWVKSDGSHSGSLVVGVPITDYYDAQKRGWQTIKVPLSDFNFKGSSVDGKYFVSACYGREYVLFNTYGDFLKYNNPQWEAFTGLGIVREDVDDENITGFNYEAANMAVVKEFTNAPELNAEFISSSNSVALRWPISATNGVTAYEVYRNDELIATVPNTSYTDTEATGSLNSTYSVKAVHGDYGIKSNAVYSAALEIPVGAVKLYEGSGNSKTSTDYVTDGTMTVSGYSVESGNTFYAARYDSEGNLLGVGLKNLTAGEWGDVVFENVEEENVIKGFIWGSENMVSVIEPFVFKKLGIKTYSLTYPTYGKKAVTFNINDAAETDVALIELMHQYGINATFGLTGSEENYDMYVHDDFEIANHTTHIEMYLTEEYEDDNGNIITPPTYDECVASIEDAEAAITSGSGTVPSGLAWPYFAPEERSFYNQLKIYATTNGYEYIRDSQVTDTFDLPVDWKDWGITGWVQADNTDSILELADSLKALKPSSFKVMSIAGNGEDMTEEELLSFYESLFAKLSSGNIWKATNLEICRYIQACDELEITKEYIYNPTDVTVYMIVNDQQWVAEPGSYAHIVTEE